MATEKTASEVLAELEKTFNEKATKLNEAKEQLSKQQDTVIRSYDSLLNAFQQLTVTKEQFLVNMINQHQQQSKTMGQQINELTEKLRTVLPGESTKPKVTEVREDNL